MNYKLNTNNEYENSGSVFVMVKKFIPLLSGEKNRLIVACVALVVTNSLSLVTPFVIGKTIDTYIKSGNMSGIFVNAGILLVVNLIVLVSSYIQTKNMGIVGQNLLFNLRRSIFLKLQDLPIGFFNQNKAGDLISRINNDTDNLNQFFSQVFIQFVGNIFIMVVSGILLLSINPYLGLFSLIPALGIYIFTRLVSGKIRRKNTTSLQSVGKLSAEIQESLENYKVVIAFNRRDYFRERFETVNKENFNKALQSGKFNNLLTPVYTLGGNISQLLVLFIGIGMIVSGNITVGLLISYLSYVNRFYDPVRQLAGFWATFQNSMGSWDRILEILAMKSDLQIIEKTDKKYRTDGFLEFKNVGFGYPDGGVVLDKINFSLKRARTYALVGPTGGGKTTTASLMARLFDPTRGEIYLDGQNIKSYSPAELSKKVGFILQEPFLFTGTLRENILYGIEEIANYTAEQLTEELKKYGLDDLLNRFDKGLETVVSAQGDTMSLGQKQIIAFMRAVLRQPELLILDEASANIDTVTEKVLDKILTKLDKNTTKVIIAHRLNTIENADEIFFVNSGEIRAAGSMKQALKLLMENSGKS